MKKYFYLLKFLISPLLLFAQEQQIFFEHFTVESRLASPIVRGLMQDKEGYLWFGTINAVHRFDGFSFKTFKYEQESKANITKGFVNVIYEDESGNLWIGTSSGLDKLNRLTGEFQQFVPDPSGPIFKNDMWSVFEDSKGILWVGSSMGLYYLDTLESKLEPFILHKNNQLRSDISFRSVNEDNQGYLWFGTGIGLMKYNRNSNELTQIWVDPEPPLLFSKNWNTGDYAIQCIHKDDSGILWIGSFGGTLLKLNPLTGQTDYYFLRNPQTSEKYPIQSICEEEDGKIWIGTYSGLLLYNKISGRILAHHVYDENFDGSLSDNKIASVLKDRSGSLWIGTLAGGLNKLNRTKYPFKKIIRKSWGADKSYSQVPFSDLAVSRTGSLFVGTTKGIEEIKLGTKKIIKLKPFEAINILMEDSHGNLWVGIKQYSGGGLYKRDTEGNIYPIIDSAGKMFNKEIHCLYETKNGRLFFGTEFYLFEIDPQKHTASLVFRTNRRIYAIGEDVDKTLWLGTLAGGLFHFDYNNKTVIRNFMPDEKDPHSISDNSVTEIYSDKIGQMWFGTSLGLNKYDCETGGFKHYNENNGLAHNTIMKILGDNLGNLWLGTVSGISRFDPKTEVFKNYDVSYGLAESYQYTGGKSPDGIIFFKGRTGITYFNPDSIKDNPFIPPVAITELKVFNNSHSLTDKIQLAYSENYISLEFAALSFVSPEKNQYAYKMEGVDKEWIYSGFRRYAAYTHLDPGKYVFRVKASNNDGVWNETGTSISLIISPPWWKTWWAYVSYVLVVVLAITGSTRFYLKREKFKHKLELEHEHAEKLEELSKMQNRFFTNISHEFRTPLTLILGPAKQISEITNDDEIKEEADLIYRSAKKLNILANQLLDISRIEAGKMKLKTSRKNLIPFIEEIVSSFQSYAESKKILLKFYSAEKEIVLYLDKDKIEKVLGNILSNALKFTPVGGGVNVEASINKNTAEIIISDTGIGIRKEQITRIFDRFYQVDSSLSRDQEGSGVGLSLTKELIELHKGKIFVESEEDKGSIFKLAFPLGNEHLLPEEIVEEDSFGKDKLEAVNLLTPYYDESLELQNMNKNKPDIEFFKETDKPLLLIIEDNSGVRKFITGILDDCYRIIEAIDGEEGLNKSFEQIPDLIISDIMMPKVDGMQLCNTLKTDSRTSHIPLILLTAKATLEDKISGLEIGADDYIMKPFETSELTARIKNLLEQRKRIHEHFQKHGLFELEETHFTSVDQKFLKKTFEIISEHISDGNFSVEILAKSLAVSRSLLHKKIVALVGEPPIELIKRLRLNKAAKLIKHKFGNISEIALEVGFNNPSYFAECFRKQFGLSPLQYYRSTAK